MSTALSLFSPPAARAGTLRLPDPDPIRIEIAPDVVATVQPRRDGDAVAIDIDLQTPFGPMSARIATHIETFERVVALAQKHNVIPRLADLLELHTGRRPQVRRLAAAPDFSTSKRPLLPR